MQRYDFNPELQNLKKTTILTFFDIGAFFTFLYSYKLYIGYMKQIEALESSNGIYQKLEAFIRKYYTNESEVYSSSV
jgi:uncharacterized membrane protein (GlpM family)